MKSAYLLLCFFVWGITSCIDAYIPVKNLDADIIEQITAKYPGISILSVKKVSSNNSNRYEVKLTNGVKLNFNEHNEIERIDDSILKTHHK